MTRIDFYVSSDRQPGGRQLLAARLIEKAYKLGHKVYVYTASPEQSARVDELLWVFRAGSFVPHGVMADSHASEAAVLIGHGEAPDDRHEVLVNLTNEVPPFFSRFDRVAEVVDADPDDKLYARDRFRFYRDRGYALQTHEL